MPPITIIKSTKPITHEVLEVVLNALGIAEECVVKESF